MILNVYADICRYLISTYHIPLESYKDKISTKLHFVRMILDSLKVISEKPQVNQVVPYRGGAGGATPCGRRGRAIVGS